MIKKQVAVTQKMKGMNMGKYGCTEKERQNERYFIFNIEES